MSLTSIDDVMPGMISNIISSAMTPGVTPKLIKSLYLVMVGLVLTTVLLWVTARQYLDYHLVIFSVLVMGFIGSVTWFLSVIPNDALKAPKEKCGESLPNERTESTSPVVRTEVVRRVPKEK